MLIRNDSSTYGLDPLPFLPSPLSILICGNSPINSIGMTKQCYLSSITGRKHWRRSSRINSSGTSTWTRTCVTRTTTTGLSISLRCLLLESQTLMFCYHSWYQWNFFSLNEPCPV